MKSCNWEGHYSVGSTSTVECSHKGWVRLEEERATIQEVYPKTLGGSFFLSPDLRAPPGLVGFGLKRQALASGDGHRRIEWGNWGGIGGELGGNGDERRGKAECRQASLRSSAESFSSSWGKLSPISASRPQRLSQNLTRTSRHYLSGHIILGGEENGE